MNLAPQESRTYFTTFSTAGRRRLFAVEANARLMVETLQGYREKGSFVLHAFVVMPDHVHVLLTPAAAVSLEKTLQLMKGGFSFRLKSKVNVWERGHFDRRIADLDGYEACVRYIHENPVVAGLVDTADAYLFSSACGGAVTDGMPAWLGRGESPDLWLGEYRGLKPAATPVEGCARRLILGGFAGGFGVLFGTLDVVGGDGGGDVGFGEGVGGGGCGAEAVGEGFAGGGHGFAAEGSGYCGVHHELGEAAGCFVEVLDAFADGLVVVALHDAAELGGVGFDGGALADGELLPGARFFAFDESVEDGLGFVAGFDELTCGDVLLGVVEGF